MTIYDYISQIALTLSPNFYYGRKSDINIKGDNSAFPAIILIEPDDIGFTFNTGSGNIRDVDSVFIQFVDKVEMGQQAGERLSTIQAMRILAAQFVDQVVNHHDIKLMTATAQEFYVRGTLIVDYYDVNVAGIEINLPIGLEEPYGCTPLPG